MNTNYLKKTRRYNSTTIDQIVYTKQIEIEMFDKEDMRSTLTL